MGKLSEKFLALPTSEEDWHFQDYKRFICFTSPVMKQDVQPEMTHPLSVWSLRPPTASVCLSLHLGAPFCKDLVFGCPVLFETLGSRAMAPGSHDAASLL